MTVHLSDFKISNECQIRVLDILRSGRLTYGPVTREFEQRWADLHNVSNAVFTNSGTSALVLAIQALKAKHGWADGSEVIVPAITFVATANAVIHNGLVPVVVDCEPVRFGIDAQSIRAAITPKTVAVIPVHILGRPCFMSEVMHVAREHGLAVIEDSCETVGASLNGVTVGGWGDAACFSTYAAHPISTGVGGFVTTNDAALALQVRSLMNHGRDTAYLSIDDVDPDPVKQWRIVSNRFKFNAIGHSYRATELEAAIGIDQLKQWPKSAEARCLVGLNLDEEIGGSFMGNRETIPMNYPIVCPDPHTKGRAIKALEAAGIQTRDLPTLLLQPCYTDSDVIRFTNTPVAKDIVNRTLYVGCHGGMTPEDCHKIGEVYCEAIHVKAA